MFSMYDDDYLGFVCIYHSTVTVIVIVDVDILT